MCKFVYSFVCVKSFKIYFTGTFNGFRTCRDVKTIVTQAHDGEYLLQVSDNFLARIYCHNMVSYPMEYLTLKAGPENNYGSASKKPSDHFIMITTKFTKVRLVINVSLWDCLTLLFHVHVSH